MTPKIFQRLAATSASLFLILFLVWPTLWAPSRLATVLMGLASIPGWLALPGLIRGKVYTHAWTTLLTSLYVAYCAMEAYANPFARQPALVCGLLGALWFVSSNLYVRGQRHQRSTAD